MLVSEEVGLSARYGPGISSTWIIPDDKGKSLNEVFLEKKETVRLPDNCMKGRKIF